MQIQTGKSHSVSVEVKRENTAAAVGSGLVEVFATPMMIALMESAAAACLGEFLEQGQGSVGTHVNVSHDAATPIGMTVTATATITGVDRRRVDFEVSDSDDVSVIGKGTHTRFIIDTQRFIKQAQDKLR